MMPDAQKDRSMPIEPWDALIEIRAYVRVKARPNSDFFEGWGNREPRDAAVQLIYAAGQDLATMDGFADLIGEVEVTDVYDA